MIEGNKCSNSSEWCVQNSRWAQQHFFWNSISRQEEPTMTMNKTAIRLWNVQQNRRAKSSNGMEKVYPRVKETENLFIIWCVLTFDTCFELHEVAVLTERQCDHRRHVQANAESVCVFISFWIWFVSRSVRQPNYTHIIHKFWLVILFLVLFQHSV